MKYVNAGICWLVSGWLLLGTSIASAEKLKIVTLNLEWFPGQSASITNKHDVKRHINETSVLMKSLDPDIFIATEVCEEMALVTALEDVENADLHVISAFEDQPDPSGRKRRGQQIAIASRLPAVAGWAEPWAPTIEGLRRGFSFAVLERPSTRSLILVYGLHLKSNRAGTPEEEQQNFDIRDASIQQLLEHMQKMESEYSDRDIEGWIIAGDMNTNHDGQFGDHVIERLVAEGFWNSWQRIPKAQRLTWKGREELFQPTTFDYIFTKGFGEPDASVVEVPLTISDHNAVVLEIELPGATTPAGSPAD